MARTLEDAKKDLMTILPHLRYAVEQAALEGEVGRTISSRWLPRFRRCAAQTAARRWCTRLTTLAAGSPSTSAASKGIGYLVDNSKPT
jgi:hypothetical protein